MKYRIKIVEYPSGTIEYYPQYRSWFTWYNFEEERLYPIPGVLWGDSKAVKTTVDVCRNSLEEAKKFLRNQNIRITYDYNWDQW